MDLSLARDASLPPDLAPVSVACPASTGLPPRAPARFSSLGGLCDDNWCWENPLPWGRPFDSVYIGGVHDIWMTSGSDFIHFDGKRLRNQPVPIYKPPVPIRLGGDAPDDIYGCDDTDLWHYDGTAWSRVQSMQQACRSLSVHGGSAWIVGDGDLWRADSGGIERVFSHEQAYLTSVFAGSDFVWAAANDGTVVHGDGTTWQSEVTPALANYWTNSFTPPTTITVGLQTIYEAPDGTVYAHGGCDVDVVRENGVWREVAAGDCGWGAQGSPTILQMIGGGDVPVWALGYEWWNVGGAIDELDPILERRSGPPAAGNDVALPNYVRSIPAGWSDSDGAWLVAGAQLYRWNGSQFAPQLATTGANLDDTYAPVITSIVVTGDDSAWAAGAYKSNAWTYGQADQGFVLRRDARGWHRIAGALDPVWQVIPAGDSVWLLGTYDAWRWDGATFSRMTPSTAPGEQLTGMGASAADDVWLASQHAVWHFDGRQFSPVVRSSDNFLQLAVAGRDDVWVFLDAATPALLHGDGSRFAPVPLPSGVAFLDMILAHAPDDIWIQAGGGVYRYNCNTWQKVTMPPWYDDTTLPLARVDSADVWAAAGGTATQWDGSGWKYFNPPLRLMSARGSAWFGADGLMIQRRREAR